MLYNVVKELWAEFFAPRLWRCSGQPCNDQQNYGQTDVTAGSAGQKGPEITLGGILINIVEGCRQSGGYDRTFEGSGLPLSGIVFKWIMIANVMKSAQIQQINLASLNRLVNRR